MSAQKLSADTAMIVSRGNGYTDPSTVRLHLLRKAAETTIAEGYDWFVVADAMDTSRSITSSNPGRVESTTKWNPTFSRYDVESRLIGGGITTILKPGQDAMIRMFKGPMPEDAPGFVASDLLTNLGPPKPARMGGVAGCLIAGKNNC